MQTDLILLSLSMQITAATLAVYVMHYSPARIARREERRLAEQRLGAALRNVHENELR